MDELKKEIIAAAVTIIILMTVQYFCTLFMLKNIKDTLINQHIELKNATFTVRKD